MCGQNKTMKLLRSLYDDSQDVLVATAGCIFHLLQAEQLFIEMFSTFVFDEAHHALGEHMYSKVLKEIKRLQGEKRPRILALTASPFRAENYEKGKNKLSKLIDTFETTAILKPKAKKLDQQPPEIVRIECLNTQTQFQNALMEIILDIVLEVNKNVEEDLQLKLGYDMTMSVSKIGMLKGQLNMMEENATKGELGNKIRHLTGKVLALFSAYEIADFIGISSALELLEENEVNINWERTPENRVSQRYRALQNLLRGVNKDSKILVFVSTRVAARQLVCVLGEDFPEFNVQQVVGHGGWDGQAWVGDQEEIVEVGFN